MLRCRKSAPMAVSPKSSPHGSRMGARSRRALRGGFDAPDRDERDASGTSAPLGGRADAATGTGVAAGPSEPTPGLVVPGGGKLDLFGAIAAASSVAGGADDRCAGAAAGGFDRCCGGGCCGGGGAGDGCRGAARWGGDDGWG